MRLHWLHLFIFLRFWRLRSFALTIFLNLKKKLQDWFLLVERYLNVSKSNPFISMLSVKLVSMINPKKNSIYSTNNLYISFTITLNMEKKIIWLKSTFKKKTKQKGDKSNLKQTTFFNQHFNYFHWHFITAIFRDLENK